MTRSSISFSVSGCLAEYERTSVVWLVLPAICRFQQRDDDEDG